MSISKVIKKTVIEEDNKYTIEEIISKRFRCTRKSDGHYTENSDLEELKKEKKKLL